MALLDVNKRPSSWILTVNVKSPACKRTPANRPSEDSEIHGGNLPVTIDQRSPAVGLELKVIRFTDPAVGQHRGSEGNHNCTSIQYTARQNQYE